MGEVIFELFWFLAKCIVWYPFYLPYAAYQKYRDHQARRELPLPTRDQSRPPTPAETAQAQTQLKIAWAVMQEAIDGGFGWLGKLEQATRALNIAREMDPRATIPGSDGDGTMTLDSLSGFALYVEAYHYANDIKYGLDFQKEMHQNKRQRTALAAINKAVNYDSGRAQFWAVKARVHKNLKQRAEAVAAARKAVELDYNDPDALRILGEVQ
ncbi:MAG: hypothetical protein E6G97_09860 [Alphaproteobacteria bacterium]|nr:MAG: hypothetical protein E6G97_09860 [Alphaproteobacteria bacterium]